MTTSWKVTYKYNRQTKIVIVQAKDKREVKDKIPEGAVLLAIVRV